MLEGYKEKIHEWHKAKPQEARPITKKAFRPTDMFTKTIMIPKTKKQKTQRQTTKTIKVGSTTIKIQKKAKKPKGLDVGLDITAISGGIEI